VTSLLTADIFVRGEGAAALIFAPELTGYAYRNTMEGDLVYEAQAELTGSRLRPGEGDAYCEAVTTFDATRRAIGAADFVMPILSGGSAVIDLAGEDDEAQTFTRPATERTYLRTSSVREWSRT